MAELSYPLGAGGREHVRSATGTAGALMVAAAYLIEAVRSGARGASVAQRSSSHWRPGPRSGIIRVVILGERVRLRRIELLRDELVR